MDRSNAWDTHGIPMEALAKKEIGYTTKKQLLSFGINKHNEICRSLVDKCSNRWCGDFERIGRWVDEKHQYRTMDKNFMESVIWVFSTLYQAGMIYEGTKSCHTLQDAVHHCHTLRLNRITKITDPSVICMFEIISDKTNNAYFRPPDDFPTFLLAWTTTPWTLVGNMALSTSPTIHIVLLFDHKLNCYILMSRVKYESTYIRFKHNQRDRFRLVGHYIGNDFVNIEYKPPFNYFWTQFQNANNITLEGKPFRVLIDHYIKESGTDSGTGFVHNAPCFGEEDFRVCWQNGIVDARNSRNNLINIVDDDGCFTCDIPEFAEIYVKEADIKIIQSLRESGLLFDLSSYTHPYPFCYRTDTPLLYKLVPGWFLNASNDTFLGRKCSITIPK